ncbi:asparagine--tRNA ligase [Anoxybacter fermentans]|uniref:Asparagine--tRNA ligase n=1 Tax=Anoxybacter fermentans TaxID=1323375 RepID=A0A3S9SV09_9FIRM|nr:asparagine--tRNA ligase [Anoxybacter fermentans]AZR72112.1 asparagine--tRNA ligase [Anoxybacter fermentans]
MHYFERTKVRDALRAEKPQEDVIILGWVRTKRVSKNVAFLEVNDGSTLANLQLVLEPDKFPILDEVNTGTSIKATGDLVESKGGKQAWEVQVKTLEIIGHCPQDYPLQKKRHSFEFLREIAHIRPRTNTFGVVNRFRSKMAYAVHKFFQERGFYYVHTPIITASDCEGAGEMFRVTTFDLNKVPMTDGHVDFRQDFFGQETSLTVSGQLEAELLATAIGDVYTFGPTFRAENSNTSRHLAEFWMIEPEMAFCDLEENMKIIEEFLKYLCQYALDNCQEEMQFFNKWIDKTHTRIQTLEEIVNSDFGVITYTEAIEILKKADRKFEFPVEWGLDLQSEHERYLTEEYFKRPMMVIDYPKDIKAFYMRLNDDNKTVRAVDVLVPQVGEIVGGSQREERLDKLIQRMEELGMDIEGMQWYLDIRRWGSVPHSGFGLGFERILMYMSGISNIRDVIPFPRTPGNAKF